MKKAVQYTIVFAFIMSAWFPMDKASAQSGGYLTVFGGYTFSPDADGRHVFDYYDLDVQNTWIAGAKVGYTPPQIKYLSFELEFSFLNPDIDRSAITPNVAVHGDVEFYNIMYNMIAKYPEGKFHPYIGGGIGLSITRISGIELIDGSNYSREGDDAGAFAWQLLAGLEIDLLDNLSVDVGYRYFGANPDYKYDTELDYKTSMGTFGLKFKF